MVYYISSTIYHQTILSTVDEKGQIIIGQQTDNHIENPRMRKTYEYDQNQSQEGLPKYNLA